MEEEYSKSSNFRSYINIVESITPSTLPTIQCIYDLVIRDFDRAMAKFSVGVSQYLMVYRFIRKSMVRRTRSGYATYIDKRHHGISVDILASK